MLLTLTNIIKVTQQSHTTNQFPLKLMRIAFFCLFFVFCFVWGVGVGVSNTNPLKELFVFRLIRLLIASVFTQNTQTLLSDPEAFHCAQQQKRLMTSVVGASSHTAIDYLKAKSANKWSAPQLEPESADTKTLRFSSVNKTK